MREVRLVVGPDVAGCDRLDAYLAARPEVGLTRSAVKRLIESGRVRIGGREARAAEAPRPGDLVVLTIPDPDPPGLVPNPQIPLDVVYEDEDLLVIHKPRGLVVHPAPGHWEDTLVNALLARGAFAPGLTAGEDGMRPGIVHRLDKDTSGLLAVAKTAEAHHALARQIEARTARREYLALVHGSPPAEHGRIEAPIGRHPSDRKRMAVDVARGRPAVTHFTVLERYRGYSLLRCRLETGRTHQIRVHLAHIGHPVAGDPLYGPRRTLPELEAQALHAERLAFHHPRTGAWLEFTAPPPPDMEQAIARLRKEASAR